MRSMLGSSGCLSHGLRGIAGGFAWTHVHQGGSVDVVVGGIDLSDAVKV